jgi:hypothetical protein
MKDTLAIIISRLLEEDHGLIYVDTVYEVNISSPPVFRILIEILQKIKFTAT